MARASEVLALASAALKGDRARVEMACRSIAANDKGSLKTQMNNLIKQSSPHGLIESVPLSLKKLALGVHTTHTFDDVILDDKPMVIIKEFLSEYGHADALEKHGLSVSNRILLSGPPGNGKTALAGAIARSLDLPFFMVDFSKLISHGFGDTGRNIAELFRGAGEIPCVLFIDEMETVLSERANSGKQNEVGEVARIVSGLLLEMDRLSSKVVLIGATNHMEMLDRAVVRRFDFHAELNKPTESMKKSWVSRLQAKYPQIPISTMRIETQGLSMSDLERVYLHACKQWVIQGSKATAV